MNKIFYSLLVTVFLGYSQFASAQSCGTSGLYPCNATNFPDSAGFENPDSVPCIIQGVAYDTTIQITMFTTFFAAGANQEVDSIYPLRTCPAVCAGQAIILTTGLPPASMAASGYPVPPMIR